MEEYAHFTDPFVSTEYITYEQEIAPTGYIEYVKFVEIKISV